MKKVLVVSPYMRDKRELSGHLLGGQYSVIFDNHTTDWVEEILYDDARKASNQKDIVNTIDMVCDLYQNEHIDGVASSGDYPGSLISSIIAHRLGLPGPAPKVVIGCQHKYYSRLDQKRYAPQAVPLFTLIDPKACDIDGLSLDFPVFAKPVKAYFSINAQELCNKEELRAYLQSPPQFEAFLEPFNALMKAYSTYDHHAGHVLLESCLRGQQATLEGFVYQGQVYCIGIIDSIMFPGTISFSRFEYPSSLSSSVQERMIHIAEHVMTGIGFDNGLFNIEFMYNADLDTINIIEINPRMCSQFADLFERVDGMNTYEILLDLAVGKKPELLHRRGTFAIAASFLLRIFSDHYVAKVPSSESINKVMARFPDVRIEVCATQGKKLSNFLQDGKSYRYGVINLGGHTRDDLLMRFDLCSSLLDFKLMPL